ncbi:MAG: hypothetical protein HY807_03195 [Nitrospirae bacterium]|nr:hypothetical protein [Nitrospirota bacterium]
MSLSSARNKYLLLFLSFSLFLIFSTSSYAGNFGVGTHAGYGALSHKEEGMSESNENVLFYGVSGEYTLKSNPHLFTGFVIDWGTGFYNDERWEDKGAQSQSNDIRFFGQFYEARLGYKNDFGDYYYRAFAAQGMDILRFKRDDFVFTGTPLQASGTEKLNLWRTSLGAGFGRRIGKWALDSRIAYSLHPSGRVEYSAYPGIDFDTKGTCIDGGVGLATSITDRMSFYAGISGSLIELDESDSKQFGSALVSFPGSTTEIWVGMLNLTYAF